MEILAVDDDQLILELINSTLMPEGHKVSNARNVDEALIMLQNNYYDLVITDIIMPGYDGGVLMKYIREKGKIMPILAITAGAENAVKDYAHYADFFSDFTLSKPFKKQELLDAVYQLTEKKSFQVSF